MKNRFFFICLWQTLGFFCGQAASLDDQGIPIYLSEVPSTQRVSCLAEECVSLYEKHGYVGLNLRAFKHADVEQVYVFPDGDKMDFSRFQRHFFNKEKLYREIGYENVFLFLLKLPKAQSILVEIYTASVYHHINDVISVFRGEAPCYRQLISYVLPTSDLSQFLSTKRNRSVLADPAYAIYDRFLTKEVATSLGIFLSSFVQKIPSKDTSK